MNKRNLTDNESAIISALLGVSFPGRDELALQLKDCQAEPTDDPDNYGSVYLFTSVSTPAPVAARVPVEGVIKYNDGVPVNILLHVKDGLVRELEVIKMDGTPLINDIDPTQMDVIVNNTELDDPDTLERYAKTST